MMSSTEYNTLDGDDGRQNGTNWWHRHHPVHNPREFIILLAGIVISLGLVVMIVGYVMPRDYQFDASLPAREMEKAEMQYARISLILDVCAVTGMGLIALGGLMVSTIAMYTILWGDEDVIYRRNDRHDLKLLDVGNTHANTYGAAEDTT